MNKQIAVFLLTVMPLMVFCQSKDPFKWGDIDPADLAMTVYEPDSTAGAVVLMDFGRTTFDFGGTDMRVNYFRYKQIKILQRSGFDQADISIPYYSYNGIQRVSGLKVQIFAPDGTKEELKRKDIYDIQTNEYWNEIKFTLPNVQVGSVIEFQYDLSSEQFFRLEDWYFQDYIPVRWSELRVEIPEWYEYLRLTQGRTLDINEQESQNRRVTMNNPYGGFYSGMAQFWMTRMVMKDVPAMVEEPYVAHLDDYRANIRFQLNAVEFPGSPRKPILHNWEVIAQDLREAPYFGKQYLSEGPTRKIWKELESVVMALPSEQEKAKFLYQFVNSQIQWNERFDYTIDEDVDKCYEKKVGNSAEINLLFLALCRQAGINASPVLISTRDHGMHIPLYPIIDQFNHVLVLLEFQDGNQIFADLRNSLRPLGMVAISSLNSAGWLLRDKGQQWIVVSSSPFEEKVMTNLTMDEDGNIEGKMQLSLVGYAGMRHRMHLASEEGFDWKELLQDKFPDIEVENVEYEKEKEIDQALKVSLDLRIEAAAVNAGALMYLSPFIYSQVAENPFSLEERSYPVDFPYAIKEMVVINLTLPESYRLEEVPEQISMAMPNNAGTYQHLVTANGNHLQLISKFSIDQTFYQSGDYPTLKNFFDMVAEKHQEPLVIVAE